MKDLVFATSNPNKVREISVLLSGKFDVRSLADIGCMEELPETHETIEENSLEKADYVFRHYAVNCFAEDTGLEVQALNGEPGVYSARYAGEEKDMQKNMDKLLEQMQGKEDRSAQFKTVITLILDGKVRQFTGILKGKIGFAKAGTHGFGYDPVFMMDDGRTLAEYTLEEKSAISHRAKATRQLIEFLASRQEA